MTKQLMTNCVLIFVAGGILMAGCQSQVQPQPPGGPGAELSLGESNFQQVLASRQPLLVDFYATWCGPCSQMAPVVEEVAVEFQGKVRWARWTSTTTRRWRRSTRSACYPDVSLPQERPGRRETGRHAAEGRVGQAAGGAGEVVCHFSRGVFTAG